MNKRIRFGLVVIFLMACAGVAPAENLLHNGSFEERDKVRSEFPAFWTEQASAGDLPLQFAGEHYEGATSALIPGDDKPHAWRQTIHSPAVRTFTLSAMAKGEDAHFGREGYAMLYGHIIYKDRPYEDATHFYAKLPPGTFDWKKISIVGAANKDYPIEYVYITVTGRLSAGQMMVDQVELTEDRSATPEALLTGKVDDLMKQLDRIGAGDATVGVAREHLKIAKQKLGAADQSAATTEWIAAADALSHDAWAAMFPDAMSDKPVEAHMIYHGVANTKAGCDQYLATLEKARANGVYLSLGSWASAVYQSNVLPVEPGWEKFDALSYFVAEAHKRNIRVFGYVAAFWGTSTPPDDPRNIFHLHPDWFAKGPDRNMPTFPDPANPEVVEFMTRVYAELAQRYDMDGIGLDYIRYPTESALNYDANNQRRVQDKYGFDILTGEDMWKDPEKWEKLREYRAANTRNVIEHVRAAVKAVKPNMPLIGCLLSDPDEAKEYGQWWAKSSTLLDYASPMNYDDTSKDEKLVTRQRDILAANKTIFLPAIGGMPEVHQSWTISTWAARVAMQRKVGCDGMIIYRIGDLDPAVASFFGKGPYYTRSEFPKPLVK